VNARSISAVFALFSLLFSAACTENSSQDARHAIFHWFEYQGSDDWFEIPANDASIRNPILAGFYPDPSIVRVDDEFFLVNSSFSWFPGVPIFRSTDLRNWTQIGHVLDRESQLNLTNQGVSRGIFAPTIRYHDGLFYMITTLIDVGGNFFVTTDDPAGPWSDPVWLPEIDGIDPSMFFDENGRSYVLNNGPPDYTPLYDGHRAIWVQEIDLDSGKMIGPREVIVDGGTDLSQKPIWIEAPHILQLNDWYYLIAAEGGTAEDHSEVVFRSRDVFGPYEAGPVNPILTQRTLDPARPFPVTSAGHADFIETSAGEWWTVFLASRPYEDNFYNTGRETWMLPVEWNDGWPMILKEPDVVPPVLPAANLPRGEDAPIPMNGNFVWRDEFDRSKLLPIWASLRSPPDEWLSLTTNTGNAVITARADRLDGVGTPAFLGRRQQHAKFSATTSLTLSGSEQMSAGLSAFHNESHHFFLGVQDAGQYRTVFLERVSGKESDIVATTTIDLKDSGPVFLRINGDGAAYSFFYSTNGSEWKSIAERLDGRILSTRVAGGFVGSFIGMHVRTE